MTAHLFRENSGKMIAVLSGMFGLGRIDIILDVVQDTFETALTKWRFSGIPDNPSAWLMHVAKNKAINSIKREERSKSHYSSLYAENIDNNSDAAFNFSVSTNEIEDSQMRLLLICCHAGFSNKNQIIITLHILCGFGISEIANGLLMKNESVKKALFRCKSHLRELDNIKNAKESAPSEDQMRTVKTILYLMFNEGYKTTRSKEAIDHDLCYEAIRLCKLVYKYSKEEDKEVSALLSLMFFNLSRFQARLNSRGELLTLEEQDRSKWNKAFIEEAYFYLNKALGIPKLNRYYLEALIASLHCSAAGFEKTDWKSISMLYEQLEICEPDSPMIKINRIIAGSYLPDSNSLFELEKISHQFKLKNNFLISASKADIYMRNGDLKNAEISFAEAFKFAVSPVDKQFLKRKLEECRINKN